MKFYAIMRPDGTIINTQPATIEIHAWRRAVKEDGALREILGGFSAEWQTLPAERIGYRCVEVAVVPVDMTCSHCGQRIKEVGE